MTVSMVPKLTRKSMIAIPPGQWGIGRQQSKESQEVVVEGSAVTPFQLPFIVSFESGSLVSRPH